MFWLHNAGCAGHTASGSQAPEVTYEFETPHSTTVFFELKWEHEEGRCPQMPSSECECSLDALRQAELPTYAESSRFHRLRHSYSSLPPLPLKIF